MGEVTWYFKMHYFLNEKSSHAFYGFQMNILTLIWIEYQNSRNFSLQFQIQFIARANRSIYVYWHHILSFLVFSNMENKHFHEINFVLEFVFNKKQQPKLNQNISLGYCIFFRYSIEINLYRILLQVIFLDFKLHTYRHIVSSSK